MTSGTSASDYVPIQAEWPADPWRVLVVCALLNLTSRRQVKPIIVELFDRWPTPSAMAEAGPDLEELLTPCGLAPSRAKRLRSMAAAFPALTWLSPTTIQGLPGCGQYAADAFRVFVQGDLSEDPHDAVLVEYVERRRLERRLRDRG